MEVEVTIKETGDAQDLVQKSLGDDNVANSPRRCPRFVQGTSPIAAPTPSSAKKLEFSDEPRIHCIVLLGNSRRWCFVPHPEPTLDYAVKELNPLKNDREKGPSRDEIREAAKRIKTNTDGRSSKSSNKEEKFRDEKALAIASFAEAKVSAVAEATYANDLEARKSRLLELKTSMDSHLNQY